MAHSTIDLAAHEPQAPDLHIGLTAEARKSLAYGLEQLLADTYALYLKTHGYHWNVTGPMFPTLHQTFEDQYNDLWLAVDVVAERIRALGYLAPAGPKGFAKRTSIEEDDAVPPAMAMVQNLVDGHEHVIGTIRSMWSTVEQYGDQTTLELLSTRLSTHEKTSWMLRAMLE